MEHFIGCDAHKKFSIFASIDEKGEYGPTFRVRHDLEVFRKFLKELPAGSKIALETSGCYYWMVDEMERAEHIPLLAHALTAKRLHVKVLVNFFERGAQAHAAGRQMSGRSALWRQRDFL